LARLEKVSWLRVTVEGYYHMTFDREPELSGSQKGRTMSLISFKSARKIAFCASLALLTLGSASLQAKDRSESGDRGPERTSSARHRPLRQIKRVTLQGSRDAIFQKSTCTADCGDGTGWECSGPQTYCEDGLGCVASNGKEEVYGICGE